MAVAVKEPSRLSGLKKVVIGVQPGVSAHQAASAARWLALEKSHVCSPLGALRLGKNYITSKRGC